MLERFYLNGWRLYARDKEALNSGDFYLSVTTVLSIIKSDKDVNYLLSTTKQRSEQTLLETGLIGDEIHEDIQAYLMGKVHDPKHIRQLENFIKLHGSANGIAVEKQIHSETYGFAGSCDGIVNHEDPTVIEIKTGQFRITAGWQACAYAKALEEAGYLKTTPKVVCYHIHRNGIEFNKFNYTHIDSCYDAFLSTLNTFRMFYFNELKKLKWKFLLTPPIKRI